MTNTQTQTVHVTVLYPLPVSPFADAFLESAAFERGGKFIGSGADGDRDLAFDFPKYPHQFIEIAESCGCRVELATLDD